MKEITINRINVFEHKIEEVETPIPDWQIHNLKHMIDYFMVVFLEDSSEPPMIFASPDSPDFVRHDGNYEDQYLNFEGLSHASLSEVDFLSMPDYQFLPLFRSPEEGNSYMFSVMYRDTPFVFGLHMRNRDHDVVYVTLSMAEDRNCMVIRTTVNHARLVTTTLKNGRESAGWHALFWRKAIVAMSVMARRARAAANPRHTDLFRFNWAMLSYREPYFIKRPTDIPPVFMFDNDYRAPKEDVYTKPIYTNMLKDMNKLIELCRGKHIIVSYIVFITDMSPINFRVDYAFRDSLIMLFNSSLFGNEVSRKETYLPVVDNTKFVSKASPYVNLSLSTDAADSRDTSIFDALEFISDEIIPMGYYLGLTSENIYILQKMYPELIGTT